MNIVIVGQSRSGKSMLANLICSSIKGYSKISLDYLVMSFKTHFEWLKLEYYKEKENLFSQFLETYFDNCTYKDNSNGLYYVLEGADLPKECILRLKNKPNTLVIYLGKSSISADDFFKEIRTYEKNLCTGGWTKKLDDETLRSWCSSWIKKSKQNECFCAENDILYFDTSVNQQNVLENILKLIEQS